MPYVEAHVNLELRAAWISVGGPMRPQRSARLILGRLHLMHRWLPDVEVVDLDLRDLDEVTVELAVLLVLHRRLLAVRGIQIGAVLINTETATESASIHRILDQLPVRYDEPGLRHDVLNAHNSNPSRPGWRRLTCSGDPAASHRKALS
ncbi:MAG: hypothetical protein WB767_12125 [Nocardioides sp.]